MADAKTIWEILEELCADLKYGEMHIKIIVHNGKGIAFDETQPSIRRYKTQYLENNNK